MSSTENSETIDLKLTDEGLSRVTQVTRRCEIEHKESVSVRAADGGVELLIGGDDDGGGLAVLFNRGAAIRLSPTEAEHIAHLLLDAARQGV